MQNNFQGKDMQLCRATQFHMPLHFIKNCDTISACHHTLLENNQIEIEENFTVTIN